MVNCYSNRFIWIPNIPTNWRILFESIVFRVVVLLFSNKKKPHKCFTSSLKMKVFIVYLCHINVNGHKPAAETLNGKKERKTDRKKEKLSQTSVKRLLKN